ncbi:hypothetical protein Pla52n_19090 [Stieleria varia]|uniref:Uncharacterized protein n=1 Tax=Stieleria varia TaxID=2528005 RepID=A0A5C6B4F0_9BACT|nr:hypothetical protein Pla52n_19090 [Stieleria varia]
MFPQDKDGQLLGGCIFHNKPLLDARNQLRMHPSRCLIQMFCKSNLALDNDPCFSSMTGRPPSRVPSR